MKILHVDSSPNAADTSHSRRLSAHIVARLTAADPGATVTHRDVAADRLPHIDTTIRQAWMPERDRDADLDATAERSGTLVAEMKEADVIVIGAPMYNFSVPSTLKAWIDHVAIAGQTFRYGEKGPVGLLSAKAYLALSSGGVYSQGPASHMDHLGTYLNGVMGFLGITDVQMVRAEGTAYSPESAERAMAEAMAKIDAMI